MGMPMDCWGQVAFDHDVVEFSVEKDLRTITHVNVHSVPASHLFGAPVPL